MARWADYSAGRPSGAALRKAGFSGVIRYIGLGSEGKQLVASEYRDLVGEFGAANVLLVAEAGTGDAWGTETDDDYGRGVAYGRTALSDARAQGVPDWVGLACAADAHAQAFQLDDVVRYASGFRDAVGQARCGFYGFSETLAAVHNAGIGSWYWRCGSEPTQVEKQWVNFWQRNRDPQRITVAGIPCDINEVYRIPTTEDDMPSVNDLLDASVGKRADGTDVLLKDAIVNTYLAQFQGGGDGGALAVKAGINALNAKLDALTQAVAKLAADPEITPDALKAMLNEAIANNVKITGSVEITGANAEAAQ
ncbi:glycoside hydrolase domain-containing protein [Amycolatopsis sp. VC5-11]|uniref:glycoside hydrolase domain-containing protein n=1 Tax=Amycolatopsis sp. VC5-11 TaxID=3120156 RepID=UPI00300B2B6A